MVLHEEHHQPKCSSRPSSKKNKAKKIPQRGLGVAQLEKLRIEEQQKISNNVNNNNSGDSPSSSNPSPSSLVLTVASPQPPQQRQQQPSLPFLPPPRDHTIPLIRSAINSTSSASQTMDFFKSSNAQEIKYLSSLWGDEIGNLNVAESAKADQQQQYMPSIGLINSKAAFIPLSSGMNLQTEPPSNQNYNTNSSSRREEDRIVGTNLPWPFHPETAVSFPYKVPQFSNPFLKPEESMSIYGRTPLRFEYKSTGFSKEGTSSKNSYQVEWRNSEVHINKRLKENVASADNGFLTLGSSATQNTSKLKQPMAALPEFSLLQSQGGIENAVKQSASSSERTFFSFLPMRPAACETDANEQSDEAVDGVDTSLKL